MTTPTPSQLVGASKLDVAQFIVNTNCDGSHHKDWILHQVLLWATGTEDPTEPSNDLTRLIGFHSDDGEWFLGTGQPDEHGDYPGGFHDGYVWDEGVAP